MAASIIVVASAPMTDGNRKSRGIDIMKKNIMEIITRLSLKFIKTYKNKVTYKIFL
ncbi:hypothetical protein HS5_16040 [Acidianus sp. HS-5]|nr:hypothetical protein HS5_16040 [Acidianus sp. HS-5]